MAARDYRTALARFGEADASQLESMAAAHVLWQMGACASALGLKQESLAHHRAALARLRADGLLEPGRLVPDVAKVALSLAIGASDVAIAAKYLRLLWGAPPSYVEGFKISPVMELEAWCGTHNVQVTHMDPLREIQIDSEGLSLHYYSGPTWHATIPSAEIIAGWDFPIAPTGEVLTGASYTPLGLNFQFMPSGYCDSALTAAHVWSEHITRVDEDALFLSTPERHHYGHWLTEFLPRLRAWLSTEMPRRKLAISAALPQKHRDLLSYFDVRKDDLIECDLGRRYAFRSLLVVRSGHANAPNPKEVAFLSAALRPKVQATHRSDSILFLERQAGTRRPVNTEELNALFSEYDVKTVNPALLSLDQQVDLLRNTRAIIGAFGTELYCLYHLPPGATVIELNTRPDDKIAFGVVSALVGINYQFVQCTNAPQPAKAAYKRDADIVVDCAALRARLAALTSR